MPREIVGYQAVRAAARDHGRFSSELRGDRDVRSYRQLPLEADPPRHTAFRDALQPYVMDVRISPLQPGFADSARRLIEDIARRGSADLVREFSLPYVMSCLAIIYRRPQDVDEWISWGPDVWTAEAYAKGAVDAESLRVLRDRDFSAPSQRSGAVLDAYLDRVFGDAEERETDGCEERDIWDTVQRLRVDGRPLSRDEKFGIANLLLAGGRETVIKLVTGMCWHLMRVPDDREFLRVNPGGRDRAIAELARYLSPLPKIERIEVSGDADPRQNDGSAYVLLNWASANHDRTIWPDADRIDIQRERIPNLAFGFGRHSCLGMNITEHELRAVLSVLLDEWPGWELDGEPSIVWVREGSDATAFHFLDRFDAVHITTPAARLEQVVLGGRAANDG